MSFSLPHIIADRILTSNIAVYKDKEVKDGVTFARYDAVFADTAQTKQQLRENPDAFLGVFQGVTGAREFKEMIR